MALTKATSAYVTKTGFWIFARWHVYVTKSRCFSFGGSAWKRLSQSERPALLGYDGGRALWRVGDDFYWDTDDLDAEAIDLLVWDRQRRHDARIDRLRTIRAREEEAEQGRRQRIPDEVRAHVWLRDEGRCVRCGASDDLQFDHIIPVAKGGGAAAGNVQLLCGDCNRQKSDAIV